MENEEAEKSKKKKRWVRGIDMREFSGKTWRELEDLWPQDVRVASDAWKILSVLPAALVASAQFQQALIGEKLQPRELFQMCWVMRCEEVKSDVATETLWMDRPLNLTRRMANIRSHKLHKLGLIEQLPISGLRLYRVSDLGRVIIRNLVENLEEAHRAIKKFADDQPKEGSDRVNRYLSTYCFNWETLNQK